MNAFYAQSGQPLKKVGLRELNRNMYKYIKNPPFILTKDKKPYLLVLEYENAMELLAPKPKDPVVTYTFWEKVQRFFNKKIA